MCLTHACLMVIWLVLVECLLGTIFQDSPEWSLASRNVIGLRASPGSLLEMHSLRSQFRLTDWPFNEIPR